MKKVYSVSLDAEKVEILKTYLDRAGLTFSGYLNGFVCQFVEAIGDLDLPDDVSKMPLGKFMVAFGKMVRHMQEE